MAKNSFLCLLNDKMTFVPRGLSLDFDIEEDRNIEGKSTESYFRDVPSPYLEVWQLQASPKAAKRKWVVVIILYKGNRCCHYFYREESKM